MCQVAVCTHAWTLFQWIMLRYDQDLFHSSKQKMSWQGIWLNMQCCHKISNLTSTLLVSEFTNDYHEANPILTFFLILTSRNLVKEFFVGLNTKYSILYNWIQKYTIVEFLSVCYASYQTFVAQCFPYIYFIVDFLKLWLFYSHFFLLGEDPCDLWECHWNWKLSFLILREKSSSKTANSSVVSFWLYK